MSDVMGPIWQRHRRGHREPGDGSPRAQRARWWRVVDRW